MSLCKINNYKDIPANKRTPIKIMNNVAVQAIFTGQIFYR